MAFDETGENRSIWNRSERRGGAGTTYTPPPRPVGHPCPVGHPLLELASRHFDIQGCRIPLVRRAVSMVRTTADTSRSTWNRSGRRQVAGTTCIPCPFLLALTFVWTIAGLPWSSRLNRIKWQVDWIKPVISEYLVPSLGILKVLEPHQILCSRLAKGLPHATSQACSGSFTSK
jgi:hypothetical protein